MKIGLKLLLLWVAFIGMSSSADSQDDEDDWNEERKFYEEALEAYRESNKDNPAYVTPKLRGNHQIGIMVVDADTSDPVSDYVIHGNLHPASRRARNGIGINIGRLESQSVSANDGICVYKHLPECAIVFDVIADDYLREKVTLSVPHQGEAARIELKKPRSVTARLLDGKTGEPVEGVTMIFDGYNEFEVNGVSDSEGKIKVNRLGPKKYLPRWRGFFGSVSQVIDQARAEVSKSGGRSGEELRKLNEAAINAALREDYGIEPQGIEVDFTATEEIEIDLGDILIDSAPRLALQIVDENAKPLSGFPFELWTDHQLALFLTDKNGRAELPIVGWKKGKDLALYVPGTRSEIYSPIEVSRKTAGPRPKFDAAAARQRNLVAIGKNGKKLTAAELEIIESQVRREWVEYESEIASEPHPNQFIFHPKVGENLDEKIVYRATSYDVMLKFNLRDTITKQPIKSAEGIITSNSSNVSQFMMSYPRNMSQSLIQGGSDVNVFTVAADEVNSATGPIEVLMPPSTDFIRSELRIAAMREAGSDGSEIERERQYATLKAAIAAPGYAIQAFVIPLQLARSGKVMNFDLEPEAVVTGQFVIGDDFAPLTTETLRRFIESHKDGNTTQTLDKEMLNQTTFRSLIVRLLNDNMEEGMNRFSGSLHSRNIGHSPLDADGRFKIGGLRPHDQWAMILEVPALPKFQRRDLKLVAGVNDMGRIVMGAAGRLTGYLLDETDAPIAKAVLQFPVGDFHSHDPEGITDADGGFSIGLAKLKGDRQIVRVSPPWGQKQIGKEGDKEYFLWYDAIMDLPRTRDKSINPKLPHGHTLKIELEGSTHTLELGRYYSDLTNMLVSMPSLATDPRKDQFKFAMSAAVLNSLEANESGFQFHHNHQLAFGGIKLTTETVVVEVPNVPPGKTALRLEAGYYVTRDQSEEFVEFSSAGPLIPKHSLEYAFPITYTEFSMPNSDSTIRVKMNRAEVEVSLKDIPADKSLAAVIEAIALLERVLPTTTGRSNLLRDSAKQNNRAEGRDPESLVMPFLSYAAGFLKPSDDVFFFAVTPVRFRAVPPGKYRLQVYADTLELFSPNGKPYFERELTIEEGDKQIKISVPYKKYDRSPSLTPSLN